MQWLRALFGGRRPDHTGSWRGPGRLDVLGASPPAWAAAGIAAVTDIGASRADWLAVLAPGFTPAATALAQLGEVLAAAPATDFVFGDATEPGGHWHKPGWSPALLLAQPYAADLCVLRRDLAAAVGGLQPEHGDAARYDFALRATAAARSVRHLPIVLGHAAAPELPGDAHAAAAQRAATAAGLCASVRPRPHSVAMQVSVRPAQPVPTTVVVPTRDRLALLRPCIESVLASTGPHVHVRIVDNGSAEPETLAWFATLAGNARVTLQRDDGPFDYSALMNRAVAACTTPYVLLLNNDTVVITPNWLDELSGWLALPDVAAVGAKLYYGDDTVQHAGVLVGVGGVASHGHKKAARGAAGYHGLLHSVRDVSASTGACLLVRRDAYLEVGGMASELRVAYNDVDLCLRLRARGHRIVWTPHAELYHLEGQSRGTDKVRTARFEAEIAYIRAHWPRELAADPFYNPNLSDRHVDYRRRQPGG